MVLGTYQSLDYLSTIYDYLVFVYHVGITNKNKSMNNQEKHRAQLVRVVFGSAVFFSLIIGFVTLSTLDDRAESIHDFIAFWDNGTADAQECESLTYYKTVLRPGTINREVKSLQELFICLGYLDEDYQVDAYLDDTFMKAINSFQEDHSLPVFRAVGERMQNYLNENY